MKIQYKTKNKQLLLEYLRTTAGRHVTVQDICDYFKAEGVSMGTTTVYRQLERMVEEGCVNKYIVDGSNAAYFEYVDHSRCGEHTCFHCISWLYDIDFEMLGSDNIHQIVLAGKYVNDLAVRFSYTDIPSERIKLFESIDEAADYLNSDRSEYIYVITCFSDKGKFLVKVKED